MAPALRYITYGILLLLPLTVCSLVSRSQQVVEETLLQRYREARSDSEQIVRMGQLSDYYYANKKFVKADSLIEKQIMLAEATMNPNLVLLAYFGNAGFRSTGTTTKDRSHNTRDYIIRALEYARLNNFTDYAALAYANLAALNITDGQVEEGFKNANLAFATALNSDNDSARVICAIQLGNAYLQRSDVLMAFKTYTNAQNLARKREDESLLPPVFGAIAAMYKKLGKIEIAKSYVFQSLAINKKKKNIYGQVNDNIFLAKLSNYTAGKGYLQQALLLADSLYNVRMIIEAEKILFSHMLFKESPGYILAFLDAQPELKNVFMNTGPDYLNWMLAEIYLYGNRPDSALAYFKKAEISFNTGYDLTTQKNFFSEFADCVQQLKQIPEAIFYYKKSFDLARSASDLASLENNADQLRVLYQQQNDYKQAFEYSVLYDHYKDSVDQLGKEKDLALLELSNEEKEQQRLADLAARQLQRKHNLQYMLITIVIATAFVLLMMIGMFKVSAFMIRLMGFLSLIFFFEFVILLLDTRIHHLTHGEPWKIWLIKIGIISVLLPIHHFLEHRLIRYLLSRHLITVRSRLLLWNAFAKKKKPLPENENG